MTKENIKDILVNKTKKIDKYNNFKTSHKTIKTSLKSIIKDQCIIPIIEDAVNRMNKLVIHTLQFIKLYYLDQLINHKTIITINNKFINNVMKIIGTRTSSGRKCNQKIELLKQQLKIFFNESYKQYLYEEDIPYINLNTVMDYEAVAIETMFKNHIMNNFSSYVNTFINGILNVHEKIQHIKDTIKDGMKQKLEIRQYRSEIRKLKNDILNTTDNCDEKYNNIKKNVREKLLLSNINNDKSLIYNVHVDPLKFLPTLVFMSMHLENANKKAINCFPLRKNIKPKYIPLDTTTIIHLLIKKEIIETKPWIEKKTYYLTKGNLKNNKEKIWNFFFKTHKKCFKRKKYKFKYMIYTDGYGCSILLIRNDLFNPTKKMLIHTVKKPKNYMECPYINKINDLEKEKLKKYNIVGIDPGKQDLLFCTNGKIEIVKRNDGSIKHKIITFRYSQNQRRFETKSKKYQKIIDKLKKITYITNKNTITKIKKQFPNCFYNNKISIKQIESLLSETHSKSCLLDKVKNYIEKKSFIVHIITAFYKQEILRKLRWYSFINRQKSEMKMINNFKKKFGKPSKTIVCIGDWSQKKQMKYQEPTKGKSFRQLFKQSGYKTYLVDEYNTSKKSHINGEDLEKFKKRENAKPYKKNITLVHGLLRSKSVPNNKSSKVILFNRDINGCMNIRIKALCSIHNKEIPIYLTRKKLKNQQDFIDETGKNVFIKTSKFTCRNANLKRVPANNFI